MAREQEDPPETSPVIGISASFPDDGSMDSNFDPETPPAIGRVSSISATLVSAKYEAAAIRAEFKTYKSILPTPDQLLQKQHSYQMLRQEILKNNLELPRFLKYKNEGGIKPHHALCCLLLSEYEDGTLNEQAKKSDSCLVRTLSFGYFNRQLNNPASFIRDQFSCAVDAIPADVVKPGVLRKKIRDKGLPVPNYFLDPEDEKQFPPHIALLVILQDSEGELKHLDNFFYRVGFSLFAAIALALRIVLEVIGAAGAIWGGAEVVKLRTATRNVELFRWLSLGVGGLSFLRFVILNVPLKEDAGDILGPAGPWSLRLPVRMRAVTDHPFHYFVRATRSPSPSTIKKEE
mmetsp:Transcript_2290/g.3322  ORF Transcript_2290/g.3322 Transcript_2290/m.3322 type:complete len:347 (+) Transcript_2290:127-1167(+)